jgi:signal transduction histidine kinase
MKVIVVLLFISIIGLGIVTCMHISSLRNQQSELTGEIHDMRVQIKALMVGNYRQQVKHTAGGCK